MANPSLDALLKAIGKQGVRTAGQNVGQARTQTPLSDDRWAKFEAARTVSYTHLTLPTTPYV